MLLNSSFAGGERRTSTNTSTEPTSRPTRNDVASAAKNSPSTAASSLGASDCASRRNCTCSTTVSAATVSSAICHQLNDSAPSGSAWRTAGSSQSSVAGTASTAVAASALTVGLASVRATASGPRPSVTSAYRHAMGLA